MKSVALLFKKKSRVSWKSVLFSNCSASPFSKKSSNASVASLPFRRVKVGLRGGPAHPHACVRAQVSPCVHCVRAQVSPCSLCAAVLGFVCTNVAHIDRQVFTLLQVCFATDRNNVNTENAISNTCGHT